MMAEHLGIKEIVNSPTFNKMKIYEKLIHIDAYHMSGTLEAFEDYFESKQIVIE
jgi:tRNA threonylcarbamoyladenosine biosynthesis protein TsaE